MRLKDYKNELSYSKQKLTIRTTVIMKMSFLSARSLLLSCLVILLISCKDDDPAKTIQLRNHTESGCKDFASYSNTSQTGRQQTKKMVDFNATERVALKGNDKGMLNVFHENALFTCEAVFTCSVDVSGNTIVIHEDAPPSTNCMCNYDLTSEVGPLENKTYTLIIKNNNLVVCTHQFQYSSTLDKTFEIQHSGL